MSPESASLRFQKKQVCPSHAILDNYRNNDRRIGWIASFLYYKCNKVEPKPPMIMREELPIESSSESTK